MNNSSSYPEQLLAWSVHLFTASATVFILLSLKATSEGSHMAALWYMFIAAGIDAIDGTLARYFNVTKHAPSFDGALLDNMMDYLSFVVAPLFLLLKSSLLPDDLAFPLVALIALASAYQFCHKEAKTSDHFLRGFPCYWNITVLYLFLLPTSPWTNVIILLILVVLVFIPIKYLYISRADYIFVSSTARYMLYVASFFYSVSFALMAMNYPGPIPFYIALYNVLMVAWYFAMSIYRTFKPLEHPQGSTLS